ncbi:GntR family transcriptional regulator [Nocardioides eburneiflavus]|uniref:GntR family transcriptional regulator n=1 Tax=Nocardioides eburneiflavus TaxID=2518372 RepID=A0A4Z1CC56_9ACTN|nr:GntR family transcriptional regulator [Nocardioides eburneiflavus]TGN65216.1 GntR family transcriptional regulator [Nocardioides eburneiflavus]
MNAKTASAAAAIPRATFASIVTERLRADIVDGTLEPGSQLSEVELAASFGVSRGPVREALQRLVQEGLLLSEPHRGVFVPVLTDEDVHDVYVAREALESAAVRSIIASGSTDVASTSLDRFVAQMEQAEAAGDWQTVGNVDLEFHVALVDATSSPRLKRMFTTVISETRLCLGVLTAAEARDDLVEEHRLISEAIREGDTERALAVLKKHFDDAVATLSARQGHAPASAKNGEEVS